MAELKEYKYTHYGVYYVGHLMSEMMKHVWDMDKNPPQTLELEDSYEIEDKMREEIIKYRDNKEVHACRLMERLMRELIKIEPEKQEAFIEEVTNQRLFRSRMMIEEYKTEFEIDRQMEYWDPYYNE